MMVAALYHQPFNVARYAPKSGLPVQWKLYHVRQAIQFLGFVLLRPQFPARAPQQLPRSDLVVLVPAPFSLLRLRLGRECDVRSQASAPLQVADDRMVVRFPTLVSQRQAARRIRRASYFRVMPAIQDRFLHRRRWPSLISSGRGNRHLVCSFFPEIL